jgi:hypothetical protein
LSASQQVSISACQLVGWNEQDELARSETRLSEAPLAEVLTSEGASLSGLKCLRRDRISSQNALNPARQRGELSVLLQPRKLYLARRPVPVLAYDDLGDALVI